MKTANCGGLVIDNVTLKVNDDKELYVANGDVSESMGTLTDLTTTSKTDLVSAINELVSRVATLESAT